MKKMLVMMTLALFIVSAVALAVDNESFIRKTTVENVKAKLLKKYGDTEKSRIKTGVEQAASLWREEDGSNEEFAAFCETSFVPHGEMFDAIFKRMLRNSEIISGHMVVIAQELRKPLDLDWGKPLPLDPVFASWNPAAHLSDDFFKNKLAFFNRLNFPYYTLEEKYKLGEKWTPKEWSLARMGDSFLSRVPAEINQKQNAVATAAEAYVSDYKFYLGKLVDENMNTMFPEDMVQISHWGLRDELRARYDDKDALKKQAALYALMQRIINQEVPEKIINNGDFYYNPVTSKLYDKDKQEINFKREPDTRYAHLQKTWESTTWVDKYNPQLNTHIKRSFEAGRELPEARVEKLFDQVLSSKEVRDLAKLISKRLGRELKPWDIWYAGFTSRGEMPEEKLTELVQAKYPNLEAFEKGIPEILIQFGFKPEKAEFIASRIKPEPARGAGHCSGAQMRSAQNLLRTHVPPGSMDYKGFETAMHELGHAVEQTLTLHDVPYWNLNGVPNTAFTEAFAYLFESKGLEILGAKEANPNDIHINNLATLWNAYEIMGVGLVDMKVWNWMYDNPEATPAQLREATVKIAKEVWNKYYADVFGVKDDPILAVYSHMICYYLYLPDYPMGYIILAQVANYMEGKSLADEMQRMCAVGLVTPDLWMKKAVGEEISAKPMLKYAAEALKVIKE